MINKLKKILEDVGAMTSMSPSTATMMDAQPNPLAGKGSTATVDSKTRTKKQDTEQDGEEKEV